MLLEGINYMPLDQDDLQKIGQEVGKVIEQNVNPQFDEIRSDMDEMKTDINGMKTDMNGMKTDMNGMKADINGIKALMVTKDYLDDKLADLRGDLVILMRKEDTKVTKLIEVLQKKQILNDQEAKDLLGMEPFSRMV